MEQPKISLSLVIPIGLMLFSFFFGAGNLIFPPVLGQQAGDNLLLATLGFCFSGVGFPLLGILAMAINSFDNPDMMAEPVSPMYGKTVTILCALTIGPFFAIPRTAAVSYDTGIMALLPAGMHDMGLAIYSAFFFALTYYFAVNPSTIIDRIGKVMAPMLLICLAALIGCAILNPMGNPQPAQEAYASLPFFKGFIEGYNTMDLLCSMLFGAATINAIESKGVKGLKQLTTICIYAGIIAAICLAAVYGALAYAGATSVSVTGLVASGGQLLNKITIHYFGNFGKIVLALIIFFACITTSIGLSTAIPDYFNKLSGGKISYQKFVAAVCLFSFCVSNVGLSNIISFSIPVLCMLYPITIALVILNVGKDIFKRDKYIFRPCLILTTIFAIFDGLRAAGIDTGAANAFLSSIIPMYDIGFGWITPCFSGILLGFIWKAIAKKEA
ncbi:MAG: branched-chain amino acid transport system II carrier protein [Phascolarctobacterium sp.]|nr:branched-chain amino acid transport system II carrier protein [Phascolarctobacterium sp.]